jgi:hypothetical protein
MLRDYQEQLSNEGCAILRQYGIVYYAMEVRVGKTLTALATASKYCARNVLFLTKKKAMASIMEDFHQICNEDLFPPYEITILNYEQLHNLELPHTHDLIIIDEAHTLGQFPVPAERVKLLKKICKDLPIIYLSGTPTPESYSQIYHQFYITSYSPFAAEYRNFYKWAEVFVVKKSKYLYNRVINDYSEARKELVDLQTKHLFITYTQMEAGFTELVTEQILRVRMKDATYKLAKTLLRDLVYKGKDGDLVLGDTAVKLKQKLHQIYSGTVLTEEDKGIVFDLSKAEFIRDHFAGKKIAVFYKFRTELTAMQLVFGSNRLTDSPEEFNERSDLVFCCQIQSGSMGTNLSTADALVMYNIDFSSMQYQQAKARIQTKDRREPALLYWIFSEGGIEDKVYEAVMNKQDYTLSYFKRDFPEAKKIKTTI